MALPKEPRQKMINIMYIVLTALLALNVSKEVLNAFKIVNESIRDSNHSIATKNNQTYADFDKQMKNDPARVGPIRAKADSVRAICTRINNYLDSLKKLVVSESGGLDDSGNIRYDDNLEAPTRVMQNYGQGPRLEKMIGTVRGQLLGMVDPEFRLQLVNTLPLKVEIPRTNDPENNNDWTAAHFKMVPTIAAVTILSKFQNDVKNSESMVIDHLYSQISKQNFVFNQYSVLVSANAGYIMTGQKYEAKIMLGAYSTTVNPSITVNGQSIPVVSGLGTYDVVGGGVGDHTYKVAIALKDQTGKVQVYNTSESYTVGASSFSVSADKMNVMYIGVDNPISIAAAGVPAESVNASLSGGGTLTKTGTGHFIGRVTSVGNVTINVSGSVGGQIKTLGNMVFRTKRMPDPYPTVAGSKGGMLRAALFRLQEGVQSTMPPDFAFDVRTLVTSFTIGFQGQGFPDYIEKNCNSAYFSPEVKSLIGRCRPGTRVYIDNIRAYLPDGTTRNIGSLVYRLN
ncbi:MAG TPA: gliding motility protein GldM [Chitinophagaceae bacterium]|nr:gliding motility protein GldM [Chitinophagaceae bacterium]